MNKEKAPILILEASSQPFLSLGRHFGGVKAYGISYKYVQKEDAFVREDWMKKYNSKKSWEEFVQEVKKSHL